MKRGTFALIIAMVFCLALVVYAQLPQKDQAQANQPQVDQDRIEAAHGKLLAGEDKAKEASRLTEAVAPALPAAAASTAPVPRKNFIDEFKIATQFSIKKLGRKSNFFNSFYLEMYCYGWWY